MTYSSNAIVNEVLQYNIDWVSFDIFDTLIFRKDALPRNVFSNAFNNSNLSEEIYISSAEFEELRVNIEHETKRNSVTGECSIDDIYSMMPFSKDISEKLKLAEIEAEIKSCFVCEQTAKIIEILIKQNKKVILISDMYLSSKVIRSLFSSSNSFLSELPMYVSNQEKSSKARGELFDVVQLKEKIDINRWLHIGDNLHSDSTVPDKKGIRTLCFNTEFDLTEIIKREVLLTGHTPTFNSTRMIATWFPSRKPVTNSYAIGASIWGPILYGFADWIIEQTLKRDSQAILCAMREAEVYMPVLKLRLKQRNLESISVHKLHVSRRSTFWASIDIEDPNWHDDLIYTLVQRRGYLVNDFLRDFTISDSDLSDKFGNIKFRDCDGFYFEEVNLLTHLNQLALENKALTLAKVQEQKNRFKRYFSHNISLPFEECVIVDLGNGGTIQYQLEKLFNCRSKANLLFYSSERIYRYSKTSVFSAYINAETERFNLRQILSRSAEVIEPFLVGDVGTVIGYKDDLQSTPISGEEITENTIQVSEFLEGVLAFFKTHHFYYGSTISVEDASSLMFRYIQLPLLAEANEFKTLVHQDNFGSDTKYPIICEQQIKLISDMGLNNAYSEFCKFPRLHLGTVHWPQGVITTIDSGFLIKQTGMVSSNTEFDVQNLLEKIISTKWQSASFYGAGIFFEKLLPHLNRLGITINFLIDRKAEVSGNYKLLNYEVCSIDQALKKGENRIIISSFAFKDEIARNIFQLCNKNGYPKVDLISL